MNIFKFSKYFDLKYWVKKAFGDADINVQTAKTLNFLKQKFDEFIKDCNASKEKLKDIPGTNYQLGLIHMHKGNIDDAVMRFRMVAFLTPENVGAHYNLGRCLLLLDEEDNARSEFKKVLELDNNNMDAKYQLLKLDHRESVDIIPVSIIKEKAELAAEHYEEKRLIEGPKNCKAIVNTALANIKDKNPNLEVLDLGCGNGMCGRILRDKQVAKKITGVDISAKMIKRAEKKKIEGESVYDTLVTAEIRQYLLENQQKFDLIMANGGFNYFGDLSEIFELLKKSLNPNGTLAFVIKKSDLEKDFRIDIAQDNFSHSQSYVQEQLNKAGFAELQVKEFDVNEEQSSIIFVYSNSI
jgi:predicted TPR repeat methyltransferase